MIKYAVNPKVLIWAREESRLSFSEAVDKLRRFLGDDPNAKLAQLESETDPEAPTFSLLQAMSRVYNVSLITLCLPSPPPYSKKPTDFRTVKGKSPILSIDTVQAIRNTQRFSETIADLVQDIPGLYQPFDLPKADLDDKPEVIAANERKRLGITVKVQHSWPSPNEAFEAWRWYVERHGILVFTFRMPVNDCRGFVLNEGLPAIVVNYNDDSAAQTFTLFHEYAHVLLRQFGICGRKEDVDKQNVEKFANSFAANLLMPKDEVLELAELSSLNSQTKSDFNIALSAARTIADYFRVSVEAAFLRLEHLNQVSKGFYDRYVLSMQGRYRKPQGGIAPYYHRYLNKFGNGYLSIVFSALHENHINAVEAYDMLGGVKSRHFRDLEASLAKRQEQYSSTYST